MVPIILVSISSVSTCSVKHEGHTIATQSSSTARALPARPAHPTVYAFVCPDKIGKAACTLPSHALRAIWRCREASRALLAATLSGASGACDAHAPSCGRVCHLHGAESASGAIYVCDLCLSARGVRSVGGAAIALGPWFVWFGCLVREV